METHRWEYKTVRIAPGGFFSTKVDETALDVIFNDAGNDGWELVTGFSTASTNGATNHMVFVFKRAIR